MRLREGFGFVNVGRGRKRHITADDLAFTLCNLGPLRPSAVREAPDELCCKLCWRVYRSLEKDREAEQ